MTQHSTQAAIERVRSICLALPETNERLTHGEPGFFIRDKKLFAVLSNNHHNDGRFAIWCAAEREVQQALVNAAPTQYYVPPYVGVRGWIGIHLDQDLPWDTIAGHLEEAYCLVAPPKLLAAWRQNQPGAK